LVWRERVFGVGGMKGVVVLLTLLLLGLADRGEGRPVLLEANVTYIREVTNGVVDEYDLALITMEFDEDLYIAEPIVCPYSEVPCVPRSCTFCDWTSSAVTCGAVENPSCCGPRETAEEAARTEQLASWCDSQLAYDVISLESGSGEVELSLGDQAQFRFFLPGGCEPVRIVGRTEYGTASFYVSSLYAEPTKSQADLVAITAAAYGNTEVTLCPGYNGAGQTTQQGGTYAVTVFAETSVRFSLELQAGDALPLTVGGGGGGAPACPATGAGTTCLQDTVTTELTFGDSDVDSTYQLLLPLAPGCQDVSVVAQMDGRLTDVDLYCSPLDSSAQTGILNSVIGRSARGTDALVLPVCPEAGVLFRCGLRVIAPGVVAVMYTTRATPRRTVLNSVPSGALTTQAGLGAVQVVSLTRPFQTCTNHRSFKCSNWMVRDSAFPLVFWPPPVRGSVVYVYPVSPFEELMTSIAPIRSSRFLSFTALLRKERDLFFSSPEQFLEDGVIVVTTIVGVAGEPVTLTTTPTAPLGSDVLHATVPTSTLNVISSVDECKFSSYDDVSGLVQELIADITSLQQFNLFPPLSHLVSVYFATTAINNCLDAARERLFEETRMVRIESSFDCLYDPVLQPELYQNDPCCNFKLASTECCFSRTVELEDVQYLPLEGAREVSDCFSRDCAESFLVDLGENLNIKGKAEGCYIGTQNVLDLESGFESVDFLLPIRACRKLVGLGDHYEGEECRSDSDCAALGTTCNLGKGVCNLLPLDELEELALRCYIERISDVQDGFLRALFPPELEQVDRDSEEYYQIMYSLTRTGDCANVADPLDISTRTRHEWGQSTADCKATALGFAPSERDLAQRRCPLQQCLGRECRFSPERCYTDCDVTPVLVPGLTAAECAALPQPCRVRDAPQCTGNFVCAFCRDAAGLDCVLNPLATNEAACNDAVVCELPDGTVRFDLTEAQCLQTDESCTTQCSGVASCSALVKPDGVCEAVGVTTQTACENLAVTLGTPTHFMTAYGFCSIETARMAEQCSLVQRQTGVAVAHHTCAELGSSTCVVAGPVRDYLQCFVDSFGPCPSEASCVAAGECSDRYGLRRETDRHVVEYGACITSGVMVDVTTEFMPTCNYREQRPGIGCLDPLLSEGAGCVDEWLDEERFVRRDWQNLASTEEECLAEEFGRRGCQVRGQFLQDMSTFDDDHCACVQALPVQAWSWRDGEWRGGTVRSARWLQAEPVSLYQYSPQRLSWDSLEGLRLFAAQFTLVSGVQSETLCDLSVEVDTLDSVTCACSEDGTRDQSCFAQTGDSIEQLSAVLGGCPDLRLDVKSPGGFVSFFPNDGSLAGGCVFLNTSNVQRSWLSAVEKSLAITFQFEEKRTRGTVRNKHGATVGEIVGDGTFVTIRENNGEVLSLFFCLRVSEPDSVYPRWDFGWSSTDYEVVYPLGVDSVEETTVGESQFICARLALGDVPGGTFSGATLFAIRTTLDYADKEDEYVSRSTRALMYTLGSLYAVNLLLLSVFLFNVGREAIQRRGAIPAVGYIAILLFFVSAVRIVFMFLYPSGRLEDNEIGEYVLFELPTFLLFTTVIMIMGFWQKMAMQKGYVGNSARSVELLTALGIVLVWLIFVVVTVVYAEVILDSDGKTDCPGRVPEDNEEQEDNARALLVTYQSVVIFVTFILTMGFIWSSYRLFKISKQVNRAKQFIFRLGVILVSAFLLRCVLFLIYLAADFVSAAYMFCTLLFTEVFMIFACQVLFNWKFIVSFGGSRLPAGANLTSTTRRATGTGNSAISHSLHSMVDD